MLFSCKTKTLIQEIPVEIPSIHTEYVQKYDSIYVHDSIFQVIETKNDTIYNTKTVFQYKYKTKNDTICKTDTITKPIYITKKEIIEKEIIPWKKIFGIFGVCSLLFILLIYKVRGKILF